MNTNNAELDSVYIRYSNSGDNVESAILFSENFDIVFELEAGANVFAAGGAFTLSVALNDLMTSTTVWAAVVPGNLGGSGWPTPSFKHFWTLKPSAVPLKADHVYQAVGVLIVSAAPPINDVKLSELFVVLP